MKFVLPRLALAPLLLATLAEQTAAFVVPAPHRHGHRHGHAPRGPPSRSRDGPSPPLCDYRLSMYLDDIDDAGRAAGDTAAAADADGAAEAISRPNLSSDANAVAVDAAVADDSSVAVDAAAPAPATEPAPVSASPASPASSAAVTTTTTSTSAAAEKEIDWDGLIMAGLTIGEALARTVEAATPVVAAGAVGVATELTAAATNAAADLAARQKSEGEGGGSLSRRRRGGRVRARARARNYDVSIPYDAAIRLAYEEWKVKFGRIEPRIDDVYTAEERYELFRQSYERVTVANIAAKKKVRDAGGLEEARTMNRVELDEYADLTDGEYLEATRTPTWGEIFGDLADVASSVLSKSSSSSNSASSASSETKPSPPRTNPPNPPNAPAAKTAAAFSIFGGTSKAATTATAPKKKKNVAKRTTSPLAANKKKVAPARAASAKPLFGMMTTANKSASPFSLSNKKTMSPKEAAFAKKIEASRAAKAKKLAERKKKDEELRRKARRNFRG